ncbi:MAG: hypothetical protein KGI06_04340 [Candidatus Micrarchaeota archaeon]|nr:hypothetical protein [Candidatus Micrarchaeota archaeon]
MNATKDGKTGIETIIGACMDRRLGKALDKEAGKYEPGSVMFVRNAGGNVNGLEETLDIILKENEGIKRILFFEHNECGACNVVYQASNKSIEVSEMVNNVLVSQFIKEKKSFASPVDVESLNVELQGNALQKFRDSGIETSVRTMDVKELGVPESHEEYVLAIGKPYTGKYGELADKLHIDPWSMYCLNAFSIIDIMPDIEIAAINLGIRKLKIVASDKHERRWAENQKDVLKMMPFMRNVETDICNLY